MANQDYTYIDVQLVHNIAKFKNAEVMSVLNKEMAQVQDDFGTLLHYAALSDNYEIALNLLKLGANVDRLGRDGKTALMLAYYNNSDQCALLLLNNNASIYIINPDGESILRHVIDYSHMFSDRFGILKKILNKPKTEARTTGEVAERLISAGCNMSHAARYRDIELMKCMLEKEIDIESRNFRGFTALHVAILYDDVNLAVWLLNNGSDINAVDGSGRSALILSVNYERNNMMRILLERGANANFIDAYGKPTLWIALFDSSYHFSDDNYLKIAQILLQHGAVPLNVKIGLCTWFDEVVNCLSSKGVEMFIELLVMYEKLGTPITKSITHCLNRQNDQLAYEKYYDLCQQVLNIDINIFEKLSILDLFRMSEYKIKLMVRNKTFVSTVKKFCSENYVNQSLPHCLTKIMNRLDEANRIIQLEDATILIISKLFKGNYNQCYTFARKVIDYLKLLDIENLAKIF